MFKKKKFYKITYKYYGDYHNTLIDAKDEFQAFKKFKKTKYYHSILSFEEWKFGGRL